MIDTHLPRLIFSLFQLKYHTWGTVHFINNLCIFMFFCTVHCDRIMYSKTKKCTLFKLMFTCFEHHMFIIRKTICTCSFYDMFFMCLCKKSSRWKKTHPSTCYTAYINAWKTYHTKLHVYKWSSWWWTHDVWNM